MAKNKELNYGGQLNNKTKDIVERIGKTVDIENRYKKYFDENKADIKKKIALNKEVGTVEEAKKLIKKLDFRDVFGIEVELYDTFKCDFINEEITIYSVVDTSKDAEYRLKEEVNELEGKEIIDETIEERFGKYFYKIIIKGEPAIATIYHNDKKESIVLNVGGISNGVTRIYYSLDIFDLYQIFMHCDYYQALGGLCELADINVTELKAIRDKYNENLNFISAGIEKSKYPYLYEVLGKHLVKVRLILVESVKSIYTHKPDINNRLSFSASIRYLSERMDMGLATVQNCVSAFLLLGFLEKTEISKSNFKDITCFYIPEYDENLLINADKIAKIMLDTEDNKNKITVSKCSEKDCLNKFGEEITKKIFNR
ncbi:hypothetical protein CDLVIII_5487 [Clostridium sp. DL-VIII]|uniref:hypothetical protein n=1 Tax=Clostridium sp. DL-VIII TaxID=641107 RepID=UPI00023B0515|nr:hypothetical protein [Clostridium sp. DL-VIII]EHJ01961.1 hypothetical protein CDLVIII_5487 [Clostridium sp. DL-VIII]